MDIVLTVMLVIPLWVAAVAFGRDPRVGGDWRPRPTGADALALRD
jgi:hypothetical protein